MKFHVKKSANREVVEKMAALATAAFGLVAALAWNDAIKLLFVEVFGTTSALVPMLAYALAATVIAVFVTLWIGRLSQDASG